MTDRPLWQLLLELKTAVPHERPFSCAECFSILEYLAESITQNDSTEQQELLHEVMQQHLTVCPNCQNHYQARLAEMEQLLKQQLLE